MSLKDPNRKVIVMQWVVIAVLVVGAAAAVLMVTGKADELRDAKDEQQGSVNSLREQVRQLKAAPSASPVSDESFPTAPENPATSTASPSPAVSPAVAPTPTATPTSRR